MKYNTLRKEELEELLTQTAAGDETPPEGLLEAIQQEIPEELATDVDSERTSPWMGRRAQLLAASFFIAVVGTVLVYNVRQRVPETVPSAVQDVVHQVEERRSEEAVPESTEADLVFADEVHDIASNEEAPSVSVGADADDHQAAPAKTGERVAARLPVPDGPSDRSRVGNLFGAEVDSKQRRVDSPASRELETAARSDVARVPASEAEGKSSGAVGNVGANSPASASPEPEFVAPPPPPSPSAPVTVTARQEVPKVKTRDRDVLRRAPRRLNEPMITRAEVAMPGSTGGTAEPNDAPYGDMFFDSYGVNPFVDTEDDRLSTFGLDVDTGSYTVARSYLERRQLPPADAIRVEEFVNFFEYGDRPPRRRDFALTAEGAPSPFAQGPRYRVVRFGIAGRVIEPEDRKPAVLTFVVDVSGSMARENRLGLVKDALNLLVDQLEPGDRVGLVTYGSRGEVVLEPTGDRRALRRAIGGLRSGGSTNAEEGLVLAYDEARHHFREGAINRVILCSDGVANVGRTGPDSILARIGREAAEGVELTTVGFGMGNYNDVLMEQLADRGNGRYAYVDSRSEARRLFVENLTGTLQTIASDAKVQVEFNPEVVSRYRLLGYENRDVADHRFRDDTVDAGEIGAGHQVTAVYEVKLAEDAPRRQELATLRLRYLSRRSHRVEEIEQRIMLADLHGRWRHASTDLRLAAVVAEFAEILRGSYWAREGDLGDLADRAYGLAAELKRPEVVELADLIDRAASLTDRTPHLEE